MVTGMKFGGWCSVTSGAVLDIRKPYDVDFAQVTYWLVKLLHQITRRRQTPNPQLDRIAWDSTTSSHECGHKATQLAPAISTPGKTSLWGRTLALIQP